MINLGCVSAGITTICKYHNRRRLDIVEALQFLKYILGRELLFREEPMTALEAEESFEDIGDIKKGEGALEGGNG